MANSACVWSASKLAGKSFLLHFFVIIEAKLTTSILINDRTHQIRVHLQNRRTPILGDETYGNKEWNKRYQKSHKIFRPLLHAYETEFIHPFTNKKVILKAPLPQDIQEIVDKISSNMIYATSEDMHVHVTPSSAEEMTPLYDTKTKLLVGSTEVIGKPTRAIASSGGLVGGTPIHSAANVRRQNSPGGYVPLDRLKLEEDDWTKMELSEDPAFFQ